MLTRALIVLLLVLNLGVAAWWWLAPVPVAEATPSHPAGVPRLQLVSEAAHRAPPGAGAAEAAPATQAPAAGAVTPVPATPKPAMPEAATAVATRCVRLGPFADAAAAEAARARLPAGVLASRVQSQAGAARGAWNVVMPPQADAAAAQALAQRIDAAGFKDYYVIRNGAGANGIALGRFGSESSAQRHQAALQAAGFAAQVQGPAGATFWIDADGLAAFDPQAAARGTGAAQVLPRACTAGA